MIVDFLLSIVFGALNAVIGAFPSFSIASLSSWASGATNAAHDVGLKLSWASAFIDVTLLAQLLTYFIAAMLVIGAIYSAIWVYNHIPGKAA